ncbi:hypothetical protein [Oceanispirochaeta sp.]|uniref:hypothetical protein n=1 Tax=Oceanispirochaeta sp. TaxID=2035350 RepID=UPI00262B0602|nr:hypothetical protein [Oceanispirochaeta sp.]MDA3955992.1 hypothetical protein [Oceanispirochaeta sp.]
MKKRILQIFLLTIVLSGLAATPNQLSIPLDSPVYQLLETGKLQGMFPSLSYAKPYSNEQVIKMLHIMLGKTDSAEERTLIKEYLAELQPEKGQSIWKTGRLPLSGSEIADFEMGASFATSFNMSTDDADNYDQRNVLNMLFQGNLTDQFSYRMDVGLRYDKLSSTAWAPYTFSTPGEGFYISHSDDSPIGYSDGENSDHSSSYNTSPEMALSLLDNHIFLRWGMIDRDWGPGEGNILISENARSFDAIEGIFKFTDSFDLVFLTGTLTDWENDDEFQNMLTSSRMEFHFPYGLDFSINQSVVWVKRFELGYMNPFMNDIVYQNTLGNYDNMYLGLEMAWNFHEGYQVYGSYTSDEMRSWNPSNWFTEVRNIFALQGGLKSVVSFLPFTTVTVQYTRLEPYFYTHYAQKYPSYTDYYDADEKTRMYTYYANKGENLGYPLPPDSDELLIKLSTAAFSNFLFDLSYRFMTHSDQYGSSIQDAIDYDLYEEGGYDQKNHNGNLIEMINALSLDCRWDVPELPVTLKAGYGLVIGEIRDSSDLKWNGYQNNILSIGAEFYY